MKEEEDLAFAAALDEVLPHVAPKKWRKHFMGSQAKTWGDMRKWILDAASLGGFRPGLDGPTSELLERAMPGGEFRALQALIYRTG